MAFYTKTTHDNRPLYHKTLADAKAYAYDFVKDPRREYPAVRIYNGKTGKEVMQVSGGLDRLKNPYVFVKTETEFSTTSGKMDKKGKIYDREKSDHGFLYAFTYADTHRRAIQGDYSTNLKDARLKAARLSIEKKRPIEVSWVFIWNGKSKLQHIATYKDGKLVRKG